MENEQLTAETEPIVDTSGCNGIPMPTDHPTPNGSWSCTSSGWVWIKET